MIVHVVDGKKDFVKQPEMSVDGATHVEFFLQRIADAAVSGVHKFEDESRTKSLLEQMASGTLGFEAGGQELARIFSKDHVKSSSAGAFFVFQLGVLDPDVRLYSLIKYDYREAIELYANEGMNALRQIVQAFVKERKSIQKSCLVRIAKGKIAPEVSAFDRMGDAPDLTDYFQRFLEVKRDRDNQELNRRLTDALKGALVDSKKHLPGSVSEAFASTKSFLSGREVIDDEAVREAVFVAAGRPEEDVRSEIDKAVAKHMRAQRLTGVTFKPDAAFLKRAARLKLKTVEDVILEYPGEQENRAVTRVQNDDGGWTITIKTAKGLVEDGPVGEKARRTS